MHQFKMCHGVINLLIVCLFVGFSTQEGENSEALLKVSLYYEALCPDSINFIVKQLKPACDIVGNYINLDFVPYGKASQWKTDGKWKFSCQHGPRECFSNLLQGCAIHQNLSQPVTLDFISCVMGSSSPAKLTTIERCAIQGGINYDELLNCDRSDLGSDLLAQFGDRTKAVDPTIRFVPTIIYNDVFDNNKQSDSLHDFLFTVCDQLKEKPKACPQEIKDKSSYFWWM